MSSIVTMVRDDRGRWLPVCTAFDRTDSAQL